jgi:hypothetical protein
MKFEGWNVDQFEPINQWEAQSVVDCIWLRLGFFIKPLLNFVLDIEQQIAIQWNILRHKRPHDVSEDTGEDRHIGVPHEVH